jgi:Icc-related predicted phosphoesterase
MRCVFISDTHLRHTFSIPNGDVLVHSGDATIRGDFFEVREFADWFKSFTHAHKIFVAGNHDWLFEKDPELARSIIKPVATYLQDSSIEINGLVFYGAPWSPRFMDWAFNVDRGLAIAKKWAQIPKCDVLITHGPPYGILDTVHRNSKEHLGCEELAKRVRQVRPKIHAFGHIHGGHNTIVRKGTQFINASICDEAYRAVNSPIVVDI